MNPTDTSLQRMLVGIAHALFMNRLHLLRLTEVVRLGIKPDAEDGTMEVPPEIDRELRQQALNYVITCFPEEFHEHIDHVKAGWLQPA